MGCFSVVLFGQVTILSDVTVPADGSRAPHLGGHYSIESTSGLVIILNVLLVCVF